ncbi:MAG TPA: response regulator transcription factor [Ignavibacteria bacterium]|nr:response regulator transcription factor [Ignavibacteria bacterium]HMR00515.1 response regulator transcription factor [Ignavibacteria bacterium]
MRILVIEDEKKVSEFIRKGLEEQSYVVDTAADGSEGERLAGFNEYDVIILDVLLPKQNGWITCRNIRSNGVKTPILMLTSLGETEDKVKGLDLGADDYLTKPFAFDEFLARVRALIRRSGSGETTSFTLADLEMDLLERKVNRAGKDVQLTQKEFALLEYLLRNKKKVMTRTQISEHVWGMDFDSGSNVVDSYIKMLRKKIDKDFSPQLIHTIVGVGYVMREEK